jgi:collagenase-like PrtC family protease
MIQISKLEGLTCRIELMDEFTEVYSKMLAQAAAAKDKKTIREMRKLLQRQFIFLMGELIRAKKEEDKINEILQ